MARQETRQIRQWMSDRERRADGDSMAGIGKLVPMATSESGCASKRWEKFPRRSVETSEGRSSRRATGKTTDSIASQLRTLADQWLATSSRTKYKRSTQKNHRHIQGKHLVPRFGISNFRCNDARRSRRT